MLSKKSLELLVDLVEIKLGSLEVFDRDDQKVLRDLEAARKELSALTRTCRAPMSPLSPSMQIAA